jgi:hypothetical protein
MLSCGVLCSILILVGDVIPRRDKRGSSTADSDPDQGILDSRPLFSIVDCSFRKISIASSIDTANSLPFHSKTPKRCHLNSQLHKNRSQQQRPKSMPGNALKASFHSWSTNSLPRFDPSISQKTPSNGSKMCPLSLPGTINCRT